MSCSRDPYTGTNQPPPPIACHGGLFCMGGLFTRSSVMPIPTLRFYGLLPSPGMQWSVVANGRVRATLQQLLLWWLLSPVTLSPLRQ